MIQHKYLPQAHHVNMHSNQTHFDHSSPIYTSNPSNTVQPSNVVHPTNNVHPPNVFYPSNTVYQQFFHVQQQLNQPNHNVHIQ